MTAATLREVLEPAVAGRYAVAGLVVLGWEDAVAFVEAAEATGRPIILQAGPGSRQHTPVEVLGKMFRVLADQVSVPVVCHIDHARSIEECRKGIDNGFTSVMFDGSDLPVGQNIAVTARVSQEAHATGVSVEGEIGFVGYADGARSALTSVDDATRFERESGVDAMAISVGNVHLQTSTDPGIDRQRLAEIAKATSLPLVLHGGSGIPAEMRRMFARDFRVAKFNIGTELRQIFGTALRKTLADRPDTFDRLELLKPTIQPMREAAMEIIDGLHGETT